MFFCAKDLTELKYQKLIKNYQKYDGIEECHLEKLNKRDRSLVSDEYIKFAKETHFCNSQSTMVDIDDLDQNKANLVVFDDCITDANQQKIIDFFIRGRKKNATVIYLTQSYYATPITIRRSCDIFVFTRLHKKDRKRILTEIDGELPNVQLKPYEFLLLNTNLIDNKRYELNNFSFII